MRGAWKYRKTIKGNMKAEWAGHGVALPVHTWRGSFFLIQPYFGYYVLCIYIWACIYMCYLRPDSLLAALMDDLVYLHRSVEYKCAWSCPGPPTRIRGLPW